MAGPTRELPDAIGRRDLLYTPQKKPADFAAQARAYLQRGRRSDALDFIQKVDDEAQRRSLRAEVLTEALRAGDAFLLGRIDAAEPLQPEQWRQALEAARSGGKPRYALRIARRLGDAEAVAALEKELGIAQPAPPISAAEVAAVLGLPVGLFGEAAPPGDAPPADAGAPSDGPAG